MLAGKRGKIRVGRHIGIGGLRGRLCAVPGESGLAGQRGVALQRPPRGIRGNDTGQGLTPGTRGVQRRGPGGSGASGAGGHVGRALGGRLHVTETGVGLLSGGLGLLINGTGYLASGYAGVLAARGNAILRILRLHGGLCGIADPALLGDKIDKTETPHSPGNEAGQSEAQDNANPARIAVRTG